MPGLDPMLMQFLARMLGNRLTPQHIEGALLAKGAEEYGKSLKPKPPPGQGPEPQAGGQVTVNKQVPGAGPLRSGTTPEQIAALASILGMPGMGQNLAKLPPMQPHAASPQAGIPGVPGPTMGV